MRDEIKLLAEITGQDKPTLMRKLMLKGLKELKLDMGIEAYSKGKASLEKSSRIADVSIWRLLYELSNKKIGIRYKLLDAHEEIGRMLSRDHKR